VVARVDLRELVCRSRAHEANGVGRPVQCLVMNNDWDPISREMNVTFNAVTPERHAVLERGHRVFRRQFRTPSVGKDQTLARCE
jgi:hypothetical protein